jgi:hypothetical protein
MLFRHVFKNPTCSVGWKALPSDSFSCIERYVGLARKCQHVICVQAGQDRTRLKVYTEPLQHTWYDESTWLSELCVNINISLLVGDSLIRANRHSEQGMALKA